jgi:hypothetical protein
VCAPGLCADGYAFFAVVGTCSGTKTLQLNATTLEDAHREVAEKTNDRLLYIESRKLPGR